MPFAPTMLEFSISGELIAAMQPLQLYLVRLRDPVP